MERIYREAFPNAQKVVNPRLQMDRRLRELRSGSSAGETGVLALISVAGPVVRASEGLKIQGLSYRSGEMILNITADSLERVDKLRASLLEQGGLDVELQSASSREGRVNSRLLIRGATG
jgi:general secretion pathway protein L